MRKLKFSVPSKLIIAGVMLASAVVISGVGVVSAAPAAPKTYVGKPHCGQDPQVETSINIGCRGEGNPILDMMFATLRLLSNGVGIILVGSMIYAGIQYTMSAGDPQANAKAVGRIRAVLFALLLYIFAYPLLNWLLPAGFF